MWFIFVTKKDNGKIILVFSHSYINKLWIISELMGNLIQ